MTRPPGGPAMCDDMLPLPQRRWKMLAYYSAVLCGNGADLELDMLKRIHDQYFADVPDYARPCDGEHGEAEIAVKMLLCGLITNRETPEYGVDVRQLLFEWWYNDFMGFRTDTS